MAVFDVVLVVGTAIHLMSFVVDIKLNSLKKTTISYIIATDGANGRLTNAGGHLPDVRLWDDTGKYLGGKMDPGKCGEGRTDCTTEVNTQDLATYTLFSGNSDAICIAWTSLTLAGGQENYGFHPGNFARACGILGFESGNWYYAGMALPGINSVDDTFCAWVDSDGDLETTGFQVHWPEFDAKKVMGVEDANLDHFCRNSPPFNFRKEKDPDRLYYWSKKRDIFSSDPSIETSPAPLSPAEKKRAANTQTQSLSKRMAQDTRIVKSHFQKHSAAELCGSARSIGQSFVSYSDRKFCFMPTKTLYHFCEDVEGGACWSDEENKVISKGGESGGGGSSITSSGGEELPDLGHITDTIIWGVK